MVHLFMVALETTRLMLLQLTLLKHQNSFSMAMLEMIHLLDPLESTPFVEAKAMIRLELQMVALKPFMEMMVMTKSL